jgi:hypothetical protein
VKFYFVLEGHSSTDPHRTAFQLQGGCKNSKIIVVPVIGGGDHLVASVLA